MEESKSTWIECKCGHEEEIFSDDIEWKVCSMCGHRGCWEVMDDLDIFLTEQGFEKIVEEE